ncbi:hypothetical protein PAGU2196_30740 [Pseudomonas sp. PAGU 2196]|nr:hypothetical protein PAGU2196_30740 [Pseudomonas sp. PAGU 2196]
MPLSRAHRLNAISIPADGDWTDWGWRALAGEAPLHVPYLIPDPPPFVKVRLFYVTLPLSKWRAES